MVRQGKRLILTMLGASIAWSVPAHAQTAGSGSTEEDASSAPKPVGNPGQWFGADAYPPEARRRGEEGTVRVGVLVDSAGVPSKCSVTESSGSAALDQRTCSIFLEHVRFRPGIDGKGRAISSTWHGFVTWRLESNSKEPTPIDLASGALTWGATTQYTLDEHGAAVDCTSISVEGGAVNPCLSFVPGTHMGPPLSENGVAVRGRLTLTISSKIEPLPPEK